MAKKIPFNVVFASDEESDYPASELNNHGPAVLGWRSKQNSPVRVPKEIVLKFHFPAKVYRIQVLAHQFLIPERIELFIHYSSKNSTPSGQSFEYIGFVALSDNASTNFQTRELQSVSITPKCGTHLKLRMGNPYQNPLNPHQQLSLIAINILGEEFVSSNGNGSFEGGNLKSTSNTEQLENSISSSICDDLAFSMYVEESVAEIVREMETRKLKAVNDERFEYARKLKLCMNALRTAGERLGRYALAKRQAVHQEDFNIARLRKEQIEMYKQSVFEKLQIDKLIEKEGPIPENDACSEIYATKPALPSPPSLQDVASALTAQADSINSPKNSATSTSTDGTESSQAKSTTSSISKHEEPPNSPLLNLIGRSPNRGSPNTGSLRRRNKSAPRNMNYDDYDERAIPTLRHSHTNEFLRECQGAAQLESESSRGRSKLNDRERRQAAIPILVFGTELVELYYSRQFQDREDGLFKLRNILKDSEEEPSYGFNKIARAATLLLHRAIRDAVFSVFNQAAETVRCLFVEFIPNKVTPSEVSRCVDRLLPELLAKSGDPSPRIHTLAQHTILSIAACNEVREQHLVAPALSRPVTNGTHPRLALSRMQMLEQLVLSQGISQDKPSGLTCRSLSECGCSGIHHPAESVRKVAERVLLLVYKVNPRLVRKQLPPDDDITRRNLLYRQLFTEFDKNDAQRKRDLLDEKRNEMATSMYEPHGTLGSNGDTLKKRNIKVENSVSFSHSRTSSFQDQCFDQSLSNLKISDRSSPVPFDNKNRIYKSKSGHSISQSNKHSNGFSACDNISLDTNQVPDKVLAYAGRFLEQYKTSDNSDNQSSENDLRCPFCNWLCSDNASLDRHYWKACPYLTKCPQCLQVLEIPNLNDHFLNECDVKNSYVKCSRCSDAVLKELIEIHCLESHCKEQTVGISKCPLCHESIYLPMEGGWKRHLLNQKNGCPANAKRRTKI